MLQFRELQLFSGQSKNNFVEFSRLQFYYQKLTEGQFFCTVQQSSVKFSLKLITRSALIPAKPMNAEEALRFIEDLLFQQGRRLTDLQRLVFLGTWNGRSYKSIYSECKHRCSLEHLKQNVGYQLWQLLSEVLEEKVLKNTLQGCVHRAWQKWHPSAQHPSTQHPSDPTANKQFQPELASTAFEEEFKEEFEEQMLTLAPPQTDWGNAPLDKPFFGCTAILEPLDHAIRVDLCRLLSLYGISGIGKTALALQLARQVMDQFEFVIWRSLEQAPTLTDLLTDLTLFSHQQAPSGDLAQFMQYITSRRCLIVLDGFESVLRGGTHDGSYREGYEMYGELLRQVGSVSHESCLIVTSWENPKEMLEIEVNPRYVQSKDLRGLGAAEVRELFKLRNCGGSELNWRELTRRYWGHPIVLNSIATDVWEFCRGDTARFLEQFNHTSIPERFRPRLDQQFGRLSRSEQSLVRYLQQKRDPVSIADLQNDFREQISDLELMRILRSLIRRALIEVNAAGYSLQNMAVEYLQMLSR